MKILLAGDSWGLGEWAYCPLRIEHKGLEQYMLNDGHEVTNISQGGGSNYSITQTIQSLPNLDFDYIFYIQTDPLRDLPIYVKNFYETCWFKNYKELLDIIDKNLLSVYDNLNNLNVPIYVLGGCHKVNTELLKQFSNLRLVMSSIPEFLEPGYTAPEVYLLSSDWHKHIDDRWDLETIDKLIEQMKIWEWLKDNSFYFEYDSFHPDRRGYKKVYNYIKEYILK